MKIYKTYKFRMYPQDNTRYQLNMFLGTTRFIYNYYLTQKKQNPKLTFDDMKKELPKLEIATPWLKDVDGAIPRTALANLEYSYKNYYARRSGKPKYKKYGGKESYQTPCLKGVYHGKEYQTIKLDLKKRTIKLPKLEEIAIRGYNKLKKLDCKIINATVKRIANKYYLYLLVSENIELPNFEPKAIVGLDLGVKNIVVTSSGEKFAKMEQKKLERKLKGLNRWLARSQKGSRNRLKIINKIEVVNEKIKNIRRNYNHLITNKIIRENDIIAIETLKVKNMIENQKNHLAKYISNSNFSELVKILKYKALWNNKRVYEIDTYYPSSQMCSHCKTPNKAIKNLKIREWECQNCHSLNDRDINASINILDEGLGLYLKDLNKEVKLI